MVQVTPWVRYSHVPEETTIFPQDVVHPGPHLSPQPDHTPRPPVVVPGDSLQEEVDQHVLQYQRRKFCRYLLFCPLFLKLLQVYV